MSAAILADDGTGLSRLVPMREERVRPEGMTCTLGGDPGGTLGLFLAAWGKGSRKLLMFRSWQAEEHGALELLGWVLLEHGYLIQAAGLEGFVTGQRSIRLKGASSTAIVGQLSDMTAMIRQAGIPVTARAAADVKKWATDDRLKAAGLLDATSGMPKHARDGARHALFCACKDLGFRDPLSRGRARPGDGGP